MSFQDKKKIKTLGQVYSPNYVVDYIIDHTLGNFLRTRDDTRINSLKILDPSCGNGVFLLKAFEVLFSHFKPYFNVTNPIEYYKRLIISNHLFGIDIDEIQIITTMKNIGCSSLSLNFRVFDALIPPPNFNHNFDSSKLKKLRTEFNNLYISGKNASVLEEIYTELLQAEELIKRKLIHKLSSDFHFSPEINLMPWDLAFPEVENNFDIIVGNPPWGADLSRYSIKLLKFFETGNQQIDSWSLFIEKSLFALKEGGRLGFIIPNTLLNNENYVSTRKLLLKSCRIIKIINLGENVFPGITQPSMIIIVEKSEFINDNKVEIVRYVSKKAKKKLEENSESLSAVPTISCNQNRFLTNYDYHFDIFSIGYEEIISKIEDDFHFTKIRVKPLADLVDNARGVEINKNGKVVECSSCGWWVSPPTRLNRNSVKSKICPNPKCKMKVTEHDKTEYIVSDDHMQSHKNQPFLAGFQIQRYYLKNHNYIDTTRKGVDYKESRIYQSPKLLLRKTGKGIKAVVDYHHHWVNQVVYIFKLKENSPVTLEYILGILNSKLIQKYFYIKFADPFRQEFPHFTQKKFLTLPIKIPLNQEAILVSTQIGEKAKLLQSRYQKKYFLKDQDQSMIKSNVVRELEQLDSEIIELEEEINELVVKSYHLTPNQQKSVYSITNC
ncbi:MAG: Eco57I restriction-modification methylase domain-containing protein [Candidatus Hodarchaeales archaeon]|jgi:hypothetical protein